MRGGPGNDPAAERGPRAEDLYLLRAHSQQLAGRSAPLPLVRRDHEAHRALSDNPASMGPGSAAEPGRTDQACCIAERRHAPGPTGRVKVQNSSNFTGSVRFPSTSWVPLSSVV